MTGIPNGIAKVRSIKDAEALLNKIKDSIAANGLVFMNQRRKNTQALADLGITVEIQKKIINDLEATDYCGGPEKDEKYPWKEVAIFGYDFRGIELYIKFSIGLDGMAVVCLSFHESEHPMRYPFN